MDHLRDAAEEQRIQRARERREREEVLADYTKRSLARAQPSIRRSASPPESPASESSPPLLVHRPPRSQVR